ncbi:Peptidase family U32 [Actinokineospora alba]|uniref:Peptidase family U32 n=1 Tax=Actinokineospora alba TaxID=504798 RepID=A0A1H0QUJ3_9PSEU|nr:peptidase U32-like protein [Actinokineospora alba]SDI32160.1 Peptidase family U32 [Actinokineospora alba]SDP20376.1 Peptidase family U32 [Actinokineospora alba]
MTGTVVNRFFDETRAQLSSLGLPEGEGYNGESSTRTFADGSQFRIEVPTINSAKTAETLLAESVRRGFTINRVTETLGMFRHTTAEVRRYAELGREYGAEILMSVGPRANYDIGAGVQTPEGSRIGYRLRGQEQVVRAVEDVKRAIDLGITGFVVYDEGLLWVLNELRGLGHLPADIHLKVSAHCGHANPASARLLQTLGANSFNPVRDLTLPMIAAIRRTVRIPLDIHVDNPKDSGGFIRTYDAPEFVRIAAPVYLKTGNSALEKHGTTPSPTQIEAILTQIEVVTEFLGRHYPQAKQSPGIVSLVPDDELAGVR